MATRAKLWQPRTGTEAATLSDCRWMERWPLDRAKIVPDNKLGFFGDGQDLANSTRGLVFAFLPAYAGASRYAKALN